MQLIDCPSDLWYELSDNKNGKLKPAGQAHFFFLN